MRLGNIFRNRTYRSRRKLARSIRSTGRSARRPLVLESLEQRHLLSVVTITADDLGGNGSNNAVPDEFRLLRNGTDLEVYIDGNLSQTVPLAGLTDIVVQGSSDSDKLIIDFSGGTFAVSIFFDGEALGTSLVDVDQLVLVGDPGSSIGRMSYFAGALFGGGANDGRITIDPDNNAGPGAGYPGHPGAWNGDEMFITFQNLSPVIDTVPAAQLDIFATNTTETISIIDGPVVGSDQTITVRSDSGTFEEYSFANKTRVTVNSLDGSDVFNLNYTVAVPGLQLLDLYGNEFTGGTIESDDAKGETFNILATGPGSQANRMFGQNGSELYTNAATKYLDAIQSNIQMHGQAGLSVIDLSDVNDPTGDNVQIFGDRIIGAAPGTIELYFATIEDIRFEATSGDDVITILSTFAPFQYRISGGPGSDVFRVGSFGPPTALNWATFGTGVNTIGQIKGPLTIIPGPASDTGVDSLYVDDSGGLLGYTTAQINDAAGGNVLSRTTTLLNFDAAAPIRYEHTPGGSTFENLYIHTSKSADTLYVNATTAGYTEINLGPGNDSSTLIINGDNLGGNNVFLGNTGTDRFILNVSSDLGSSAVVPLTGLRIEGNDPAGNSSLRDVLEIVDVGGLARNIDFAYQTGGGLLVSGFAVPIDVRTMETVRYVGDAWADDAVSVTGTAGNDMITVAPVAWDSALVFFGGDPWDGPSEGDFFDQFPGVAGGGSGPDLVISGAANLTVDTAGGGADRLYVYAPSEDDLVDPATTIDPFGFGTGVIVPGFGVGNAYDTISASDTNVTISNSSAGTLLPVSIVGGSLIQTDPNAFGLVVNSGFEAVPQPWGVADDIIVDPSTKFAMLINGGDPIPALAPNGDWLNLFFAGPINIWADKSTPTQVWIGTTGSKGVAFSSIENLSLSSAIGVVNLYGDANDPAIDQNDVFEIVGTGYQSLTVSINGSTPIQLMGVTQLNIFGDDELGTPSVGPNDVDSLIVTPYADNSPQGWGIQISFDEGNPVGDNGVAPDPIVYNALPGISEDIRIVPTGPGTGQLRVTNAADGSLITVINFVSNTGFIINGNDGSAGDTDTLTLSGTTGNDIFIVVDDQNVNAPGLYTVQFTNFSVIHLQGGDGYDEFHVNPSALQAVVDGGTPDGAIQSDGDVLYVWPGLTPFHLILGPEGDNGTLQVTGAGPVTFDRIEGLGIQGVLYTLPDLKEPNDSLAEATILGSIPHLTIQDLTIHSEQLGTTNDDYFQVTARDSGALLINVLFADDSIIGNQLGGALNAELLDRFGNVIATGTPTATGVRIAAPVVSQERYYVRVFSTDGDPNTYTLEIENFAAPTPTAIVMHPAYDSGRSNTDNVTNIDNPVVLIQAWLSDLAGKGIPVLTAAQANAGTPGLAVEVFVNGVSAGFANPFGTSNNVFSFALPSGLLAAGLPGGYPGYPTAHGWMNFVSAAVRVFDAQTVQATATRELGQPLVITYDPNPPDAGALSLNLAASSDSGTLGDFITNVNRPTFVGVAEVNSLVRLFANGELVGQVSAGSDLSDGILGNGLGTFSVVSQPLTDGVYTFVVTAEDLSGNIAVGPSYSLTIDTTPPQIPTIDLQDSDDTGWSDKDNVTIGDPTQGSGIVD
ncbi:Ig-like domain-containing protein, partial [Thermogutta sp.]|uniref:Ig-like domain-containing protein n=1 Tax=Thermogutta sp. TaxID=1962930 RepID=UPI003C7A4049